MTLHVDGTAGDPTVHLTDGFVWRQAEDCRSARRAPRLQARSVPQLLLVSL
jgi:hypothetical protein